jgi:hypothetical protein
MNYKRRIERIEKKSPQQQEEETVEELLDRLGLGFMKKDIKAADSFRDVVTDQEETGIWKM